MTNINKPFIESKLEYIAEYARQLDIVLGFSDEDIRSDFFKLHTLERLIQLIVDEIVDINTHIIRHSDVKTPDDFQSSFRVLAEIGMFPHDFAERIAPTVGLRNRLVHRYEEVKSELLIRTAKNEKNDFNEYIKYIRIAFRPR